MNRQVQREFVAYWTDTVMHFGPATTKQ